MRADEVARDLKPGDPQPRGFECAATSCGVRLSFYREHPQGDIVIPPHFQLTAVGAGQTALHVEGCEVADGSWMGPGGEPSPAAPRTRPRRFRLDARLHRLALRRSPPFKADDVPTAEGTIDGKPSLGLPTATDLARRLTSASAVGQRHLEIRDDEQDAAMLFSGREVLWRNFVYEPHDYGTLVEHFRFLGNQAHRIALVVRPRVVEQRDDGKWRLTCVPFWNLPGEDLCIPMLFADAGEFFGIVDTERLYVALIEVTIRHWERDYEMGDGPFQTTYVFGTIIDAVDFGMIESAASYAEQMIGSQNDAA